MKQNLNYVSHIDDAGQDNIEGSSYKLGACRNGITYKQFS